MGGSGLYFTGNGWCKPSHTWRFMMGFSHSKIISEEPGVHVSRMGFIYFQPYFGGIPNCNFHDFAAKVSLDLSPDPISRATPFTFTLTGSMDEEYLAVALGPITISHYFTRNLC